MKFCVMYLQLHFDVTFRYNTTNIPSTMNFFPGAMYLVWCDIDNGACNPYLYIVNIFRLRMNTLSLTNLHNEKSMGIETTMISGPIGVPTDL